jgi:anthranilate phosphoribosyltransferase
MNINEAVEKFSSGNSLKKSEIKEVFLSIMNNECNDAEIIAFLMTLKTKGETVEEITGAAEVLREMSLKLNLNSKELVDTCGTGGDGQNTFNISTASAIVAATAGVKIAKHGNKSISSKSGSADLLEYSGINIDLDEEQAQKCFDDNGITFMFAPKYHKAMKNVANVRKNIKTRTIFNVLGPLSNPANANYQILGVYDKKLVLPIAKVIKDLGVKRAMVVHSEEGLDEISCEKDTYIAELNEGKISEYTINPKEFDLEILPLESLKVNTVEESFKIFMDMLNNKNEAAVNIVSLNAGSAIYISGVRDSLKEGIEFARELIISGKVLNKFEDIKKSMPEKITTPKILEEILENKAKEVTERKSKISVQDLKEINYMNSLKRDFKGALINKISQNKAAVIAEIKRASPSLGELNMNIIPAKVAADFESMGAACLSVLTDAKYFKGSGAILEMAKKGCGLPVLRKDFIIDEYQIDESVTMGADCILLIVSALDKVLLKNLYDAAKIRDLDVIVEVHDYNELELALEIDCDIIGINNRNLHTFDVDLNTSEELVKYIKDDQLIIAESGIHTYEDVKKMNQCGINTFLVGESLMTAKDPINKFKEIFKS